MGPPSISTWEPLRVRPATQTVSFWMKTTGMNQYIPVDKNPNDASAVGWTFKTRTSADSAIWYRTGSESTHQDLIKAGSYSTGNWSPCDRNIRRHRGQENCI